MSFQLAWLWLFTLTVSALAVIFMPRLVLRAQVHVAGKVLRVLLLLLLSVAAGLPFVQLDADTLNVSVLVDASASVESPGETVALDALAMNSLAQAGVSCKVRHYRFASNPAVMAFRLQSHSSSMYSPMVPPTVSNLSPLDLHQLSAYPALPEGLGTSELSSSRPPATAASASGPSACAAPLAACLAPRGAC